MATLPPRTEPEPPADGEVSVCLMCGQPSAWTSPTGHHFCLEHGGIYQDLFQPEGLQPVDLRELMTGTPPEEEWLLDPLLPAGKLVGIVSKRGEGKSLLLLDIAASKATGLPCLSQPAGLPIDVIYIDMEMGPDDLYERLADLGYLPEHAHFDQLVQHLHYYQLVALPPLDTEAGGVALEDLVERHQAQLVVIDTVSRVISGNENDADPFRELFRHTETRLKRRRVTLARLDHLGKDKEKGSRGSSAKEDPLDVVWQLEHTITGALQLTLTKGRQAWLPRSVTIHRDDREGTTVHYIPLELTEEWLPGLVEKIDRLGLPLTAGVNRTHQALKDSGQGTHKSKVSKAVRLRKRRPSGSARAGTTLEPLSEPPNGTTQNHLQETLIPIEESTGTTAGTTLEPLSEPFTPLEGGNGPDPVPDEELLDLADFPDYDPADFDEED